MEEQRRWRVPILIFLCRRDPQDQIILVGFALRPDGEGVLQI
jgi:hypothetical protein